MTEKFVSKGVSITRFKIFLRLNGVSKGDITMDIANYEVWIDACQKADLSSLESMKAGIERGMKSPSSAKDEITIKSREFYLAACEHYYLKRYKEPILENPILLKPIN